MNYRLIFPYINYKPYFSICQEALKVFFCIFCKKIQSYPGLSHKNLSDLTKKRAQATFSLRQAKG